MEKHFFLGWKTFLLLQLTVPVSLTQLVRIMHCYTQGSEFESRTVHLSPLISEFLVTWQKELQLAKRA